VDILRQFPEQALHNPVISETIAFIRESELGDGLPRGTFDKILKALRIDYRGSKKKISSQNLKRKIQENLSLFLKILDRGGLKIEKAIDEYIEEKEDKSGALKGEENYRRIYLAYSRVYKKLIHKLSHKEAIHFLEIAK